jgi:hypothetical protein
MTALEETHEAEPRPGQMEASHGFSDIARRIQPDDCQLPLFEEQLLIGDGLTITVKIL